MRKRLKTKEGGSVQRRVEVEAEIGWAALVRQRTDPHRTCSMLARIERLVYQVVPYFVDYSERLWRSCGPSNIISVSPSRQEKNPPTLGDVAGIP